MVIRAGTSVYEAFAICSRDSGNVVLVSDMGSPRLNPITEEKIRQLSVIAMFIVTMQVLVI